MDLSHHERAEAARIYQALEATPQDKELIAAVLREHPKDGIDQWLCLGKNCPYWPNQRAKREAWVAEIHRQRSELLEAR